MIWFYFHHQNNIALFFTLFLQQYCIVLTRGMLGPWIKVNWRWSSRRWQEWTTTSLGISELKWMGMKFKVFIAQKCLTFHNPMDCSLPGSSVHGISQARILEWVVISFSRGSSWPRDQTLVSWVSCIGRWILYHCTTWEVQLCLNSNKVGY